MQDIYLFLVVGIYFDLLCVKIVIAHVSEKCVLERRKQQPSVAVIV